MTSIRAARFAAVYALLRASADVADHWIQTDHQAATKGQHDHFEGQSSAAGRRACAAHVAAYTATQGAVLLAGTRLLGVRLRPGPLAAALALSAVTHYVADRREPLRLLADATGKGNFYSLGTPAHPAHPVTGGGSYAPTLGTGAYALDQAWHHAFEAAAALIASA
ncbi:transcriptional regulator [Kitasatospora purpeofusca]|uniref:transcriptional regulator n=1 Tax=Kitasatospora purpeofusca TaxID=67352 RepID=UPI002E12C969|nr:transcriptional regulator [Kitasatospora purpeofusca]